MYPEYVDISVCTACVCVSLRRASLFVPTSAEPPPPPPPRVETPSGSSSPCRRPRRRTPPSPGAIARWEREGRSVVPLHDGQPERGDTATGLRRFDGAPTPGRMLSPHPPPPPRTSEELRVACWWRSLSLSREVRVRRPVAGHCGSCISCI